jgi:hypothetical protein
LKRGRLLLYALRIASINLPREPRTAEPAESIDQVEEIQHDPIHGPIAPVAEVVPEAEYKGWAHRLIEELHEQARASHEANASANPEPTEESAEAEQPAAIILPELQAVAHTRVPHPRPALSGRVGYRSRKRTTALPPPTKAPASATHKRNQIPCRQTPSGPFATLRMTTKTNKGQRRTDLTPASLR